MTRNDAAPDLILLNGNICTLDSQKPQAEAIAVKAGRIIAVGENDAIGALAGQQTERIVGDHNLEEIALHDGHVDRLPADQDPGVHVIMKVEARIGRPGGLLADFPETAINAAIRSTLYRCARCRLGQLRF